MDDEMIRSAGRGARKLGLVPPTLAEVLAFVVASGKPIGRDEPE